MTITQVVQKLRIRLRDDLKAVGSIVSALGSSSTTLRFAEGIRIEDGDYIEIDSEVLLAQEGEKLVDYLAGVSDIVANTSGFKVETSANFTANDYFRIDNEYIKVSKVSAMGVFNLKVLRGERGTEAVAHTRKWPIFMKKQALVRRGLMGSTAAAHSNAAVLYIRDGWTDFELQENTKEAIRQLRPHFHLDFIGNVREPNNKLVLDDCDAASWTQSSQGLAETLDTSDKIEGTASLKLGTSGAGTGVYDIALTSFDFTNYEYLNVGLNLAALFDTNNDPYFNESAIKIRLGNDSSANYYEWTVHRNELTTDGWFYLNLHRSKASTTGTVDDTLMDVLQFRFSTPQAVATGNIKVDDIFVSTFPITTNKRQYQLPRNVFGVNEVILVDQYGNRKQPMTSWRVEGEASQKTLVFDYDPPMKQYMEIKGNQLVKVPTANSTEIALDDTEEEAIVLKAALLSLDALMNDRLRFDKYSAKIETTRQGVLDIYRAKTQMRQDLDRIIDQFGKSLGAVDFDYTDEQSNAKNQGGGEGVFD